ncbi:MAG: CsiV family protein [Gammaproteobacteria bacterium]
MVQTRRLRSKELHYIDHPVISIIALITPYKKEAQ